MASGSSTSIPAYLHISGISINFSKSSKIIESAEVRLCGVPKCIVGGRDASAGTIKKLREKFDQPMKLSRGDVFSVCLLCKTRFSKDNNEDIDFDMADMFRTWVNGVLWSHEYRKSHDGIVIVVRLVGNAVTSTSGKPVSPASSEQAVNVNSSEEPLEIHPSTYEIFRICPRICFEIPRAGGQLLEAGAEHFLKLKSDGVLGKIPVVVVLMKYDKFMDCVERTLNDIDLDGLSDDAVKDVVRKRADAELHNICAQPLEKIARVDIPCAMVSTKETHKGVIARLIQITKERICQHVMSDASVMTSITQRVDRKLKIC
ncbi:hypothetical protein AZE42_12853 [Rhizopogon vesiculosus]|uniref:Uncharacterized protein n=1 Tax=Rhizopogon vesiculosus TaxID=180088 RepID=A0A1J8QIT5_9AGAM|nr:hypothetical protein AZE42_12853 [Rhizopogon vesiculosus]